MWEVAKVSHSGNHTYQRTLEGVTQPPEKVLFPPAGQPAAVWTGAPSVESCLRSRHNPTTARTGKYCQPSGQGAETLEEQCMCYLTLRVQTHACAHTQTKTSPKMNHESGGISGQWLMWWTRHWEIQVISTSWDIWSAILPPPPPPQKSRPAKVVHLRFLFSALLLRRK